jgi:prephenate dehydrogenase
VNDLDGFTTPVLTVAGGAGAMGSLFAELLLPSVDVCLLIDFFPPGEHRISEQGVALAPLVERLSAVLARAGLDVRMIVWNTPAASSEPPGPREARGAPAWLLARPREFTGQWPTLSDVPGDAGAWSQQLRRSHGICKIVGLLAPHDAGSAARMTDILLVATHFGDEAQFRETLAPYAARIRAGSLVADLLSMKQGPVAVMCQAFRPEVGVLGMHPLFGRAPGDVTGLVVAAAPAPDGRPVVRWQAWLLERLTKLGMLVTLTSPAEHDAAMSYVQALTHFALLCFAYTFVRANQDPTLLLPYRTPVFEPLLYLAARVASLAQRSPEVYRAVQAQCTRPELRRLFVETARDLLAAIESAGTATADQEPLLAMFQRLGAPWTPGYYQDAAPFEQLVAMSSVLTEPINALRHTLLRSAGRIKAIRNLRTGAVTLGAVYVDPLHHDRVDLASRLRYRRFSLASGTLDGMAGRGDVAGTPSGRRHLEAALGSLPLAQVKLLTDAELMLWLQVNTGPRTGPDDRRGLEDRKGPSLEPRPRYVGKAHFDLSLAVPTWFDDDCLTRLLVGRKSGSGEITSVRLAPQDGAGLVVAPGCRAAIVYLACILTPQEVVTLRQSADSSADQAAPGRSPHDQRRAADRQFAAALAARHAELRTMAHDWLLAHGCATLRRVGLA